MSESAESSAGDRRGRLLGVKLRALVRDHLHDEGVGDAQAFQPGAALVHGADAWVLLDDHPGSRLGAALVWATRAGAHSLQLVVDADAGVLARRATECSYPVIVWRVDGRELRPAEVEPIRPPAPASAAHLAVRARIEEGGATPIVEHGVLIGEVRGLEVCRVVDDEYLHTVRLEVGVGAHDREAFQMLHGDVPTAESLARIVGEVARQRSDGADPHPLNRLAAERLLRWRIEQQPELIGASELWSAPPPVPRANLKDPVPCVAHGTDRDGRRVVAVCSSGVDLDLIPFALDARLAAEAAEPGVAHAWRLVVVLPSRDRLPVVDAIAALAARPVEIVTVD